MDLNQQLSLIQACSVCVCVGGALGGRSRPSTPAIGPLP